MSELVAAASPADRRFNPEVVELPLLLPRWQVDALEAAAHKQGVTAGQMIRQALARILSDARSEG